MEEMSVSSGPCAAHIGKTPNVVQFIQSHGLVKAVVHGCAHGLKDSKGTHLKKPWKIMTTSSVIAQGIQRTCRGDHEHGHCRGHECKRTELYTHAMADAIHIAIRTSHARMHNVACAKGASVLSTTGTLAQGAKVDVVVYATDSAQSDCSEAVPLFRRPQCRADSRYFPMQAYLGARGYHGEALNAGAPLTVFPFSLSDQINDIIDRHQTDGITEAIFMIELLELIVNWLTAVKHTLTDDTFRYAYDNGRGMDPDHPELILGPPCDPAYRGRYVRDACYVVGTRDNAPNLYQVFRVRRDASIDEISA